MSNIKYEINFVDSEIIVQKDGKKIEISIETVERFREELRIKFKDKSEENEILEYYNTMSQKRMEDESAGIEYTESEQDEENAILEPYDPSKVKYNSKTFSCLTLYNYITGFEGIESETIELNPNFQRKFVWKNKDKSRLIESILLNIPIPAIYLNETEEGRYLPADGLQRLNAIQEFMSGNLKLNGLEYLTDYNGYKYKAISQSDLVLPLNIKRAFRDYQITCFVIEKDTPDTVKLDIFRRLNSTGIKLSAQELRNAITLPITREMYLAIEEEKYFNLLIKQSVNTNRFVQHEFILRFFGTYFSQEKKVIKYRENTSIFLDLVLEYCKENKIDENSEVVQEYFQALESAYQLFGEDAFRKQNIIRRRGPINTLLYSQILININKYKFDVQESGYLTQEFFKFSNNNSDFTIATSSGTNSVKNIEVADKFVKEFFEIHGTKKER